MLTKRVIACLDVKNGRVVKGTNFKDLKDAGSVLELARKYYQDGIDELTFLDISATNEERESTWDLIKQVADEIFIPLTVGGGIRTASDVDVALRNGADKVSINSAAVKNPQIIREIAERFGSQVLVLSVDAKRATDVSIGSAAASSADVSAANLSGTDIPEKFIITTHGGKVDTDLDMIEWIQTAEKLGAGEILLNSIDADGTKSGYDLEMLRAARACTSLPIIASGGGGTAAHFPEALSTGADAVLAASVFHFGEVCIESAKKAISDAGFPVR
jgi:cyclase